MSNELMNKLLDVFVDVIAERLFSNEAFVTAVATNLSGKLQRTAELDDEVRALIDKRVEERVEKELENFEIDADHVTGLDSAIDSAVADMTIHADDVKGLDETIADYVKDNPPELSVEASDVEGLDDAIKEVIENDSDLQDSLKQAILSGLTITVDAKIDGKPIEGVTVETAH